MDTHMLCLIQIPIKDIRCFTKLYSNFKYKNMKIEKAAVLAQGIKRATVNATVVGSILT